VLKAQWAAMTVQSHGVPVTLEVSHPFSLKTGWGEPHLGLSLVI
jgi:hypothetical protein